MSQFKVQTKEGQNRDGFRHKGRSGGQRMGSLRKITFYNTDCGYIHFVSEQGRDCVIYDGVTQVGDVRLRFGTPVQGWEQAMHTLDERSPYPPHGELLGIMPTSTDGPVNLSALAAEAVDVAAAAPTFLNNIMMRSPLREPRRWQESGRQEYRKQLAVRKQRVDALRKWPVEGMLALAHAQGWKALKVDEVTIYVSPRLLSEMKFNSDIVRHGMARWISDVYCSGFVNLGAIDGPYQQNEFFPKGLATAMHILTFDRKVFFADTEQMLPYQ